MNSLPTWLRNPWIWLAAGLALVLLRGLWLDVMDVDASQYASISMEMLQNGQWLQVQHRGADYLDKPPLLFWMSASSFALFGLSNWAYKLPSVLVALAGVWATWRFALLFYGPEVGRRAAFILASCLAFMLLCNDVRTDTLLMGFTALAVWQLAEYLSFGRWSNLIFGAVCVGCAMLAKGPIGLVMPGFAVGTHLLLRREWGKIFHWSWPAGLLIVAVVLAPMCWGLYQQFDLHPEKWVNERQGVSGLRFYFWEQSFGRITGENVWKNDTSGFYFLHVYLWAFLPWCLMLPKALWYHLNKLRNAVLGGAAAPEYYALGGFLLTFAALSMSQYKLPHYIFITLPWAAVLLASMPDWGRGWLIDLATIIGLIIAIFVLAIVFPEQNILPLLITIGSIGIWANTVRASRTLTGTDHLVRRGVGGALILGFVLNCYFYPHLMPYQCGHKVAEMARNKHIPPDKMYFFRRGSHALDFYNGDIMESPQSATEVQQMANTRGGIWVFTTEAGKTELEEAGVVAAQEGVFDDFHVSLLKPAFLDPSTRSEVLKKMYLLRVAGR